jgi:alkylation response protein AidB-like acyl-CoA dehydrogenase
MLADPGLIARPGPWAEPGLLAALAASAADADATGEPDLGAVGVLRRSGLLGLAAPAEYGGAGACAVDLNRAVEHVARANASAAIMLFQHYAVTSRIAESGTGEQRARFLPPLATGEWLAASAWSETGAGANKKNLSTKAVRTDSGGWLLHGAKAFTTSAGVADIYLVLAQGEPPPGSAADTGYGAAGQTFFLIPSGNPGLVPDTSMRLAGMRGSATGFVSLDHCLVPDSDRLGDIGAATGIISRVRESGATLGAVAVGIAHAAVESAFGQAAQRGLLASPVTAHRFVSLFTQVEAARAIVERAGRRDSGEAGITTLQSKLFASDTAEQVCASVQQMLGSAGYLDGHPVNRYGRDARAVALMGPTNDLCRELVGMSWQS